ncbi:GntR family transcriptional regulator [Peribacillus butanolivorans]|uniref:GntR family transcriptional regulator n=1 Tax=Peribacillus butanolivorans TaxID=421767 RepID=UPI0037CB5D6A
MEKNVINKNHPIPMYIQVADWIRENIQSKVWKKDKQLAAEEELAKQLEISRGTLKKAISLLINEGLLIQIHGKGTFVADKKISYPFAQEFISFAESMQRQQMDFTTYVIEKSLVHPPEKIRERLSLSPEDDVLFLKRVRSIEGEPVILLENYINYRLCPGISQVDFTKNTLFSEMEKRSGHKIKSGIRQFEAHALPYEQSVWLNLPQGSPVLFLDQLTFFEGHIPLETSSVWLRSDKYTVTSVLHRD